MGPCGSVVRLTPHVYVLLAFWDAHGDIRWTLATGSHARTEPRDLTRPIPAHLAEAGERSDSRTGRGDIQVLE